jgi:histidine ammonia-lyase
MDHAFSTIELSGEALTISEVVSVARDGSPVTPLSKAVRKRMTASQEWLQHAMEEQTIYGVNTGFGPLATQKIPPSDARRLSRNLILSSVVGVGRPLAQEVVRAMMLIRANTLAKGYSGIRPLVAQTLIDMLNAGVVPVVPGKGSLGASGDLAPLAHIAIVMSQDPDDDQNTYSGNAWFQGEQLVGEEAMKRAGIDRIVLEAKEGLAITNGTNFMVAAAALAVHDGEMLIKTAEIAAALSLEALLGISDAFAEALQAVNRQPGQIQTAANVRSYIKGSRLVDSDPARVQDAYSLRCIPQVIGPVRDTVAFIRGRVYDALNAATDNPLFLDDKKKRVAISGGNFHGQGPAMWLDFLGIALAELGGIAERRIFRMTSPELNAGLPSMLMPDSGLDSGLMMPQYTAAALVSDNKTLAHPDSVDSIPSSANQEDHVSMGANAARHTLEIVENVRHILAIELQTAAQAIDLRSDGPNELGLGTEAAHRLVRAHVTFLERDRQLSPDIERLDQLIRSGEVVQAVEHKLGRAIT